MQRVANFIISIGAAGLLALGGYLAFLDRTTAARGSLRRLKAGCSRSLPPPYLLLLLDALDRDDAEAGVFAADVRLKRLLFVIERLDRVHIREL